MEDEEDVHVPLEAFSPTDNVPFSNFDFPESLDLSKILEDELDSNPLPEAVPNHDLSSINTEHDAEALKSLDALISEPTSIETCAAHDHGCAEDCACTHDHEDDDAQHHRLEEEEDGCTHDHHHHESGEDGCTHDHHHHEAGEDGCTHDHHHHEAGEDSCTHDHHHHEASEDSCTHDHHHHEAGEDGCTHDHHHDGADCDCCDDTAACPPRQELNKDARGERRIYRIQNLSCAHCASLMEEKIRKLPGVSDAVVVYATKQLRLAADDPEARLDQIRRVCMSIEPEVQIEPMDNIPRSNETLPDDKSEMRSIGFGAVLLIIGMILERFQPFASMFIHCLAYVILGGDVLLTAFKNMKSGHIFDENFLMSLATLGAIAMGTYSEAVGVMLFYRVGEFFEHRAVEKSRRQIMEAVDLRPEVVHQIDTNGVVHTIPANQAKVGDLLLVRPGDRIPLDGIVRAGDSRVDTSPVTGEPVPVSVRPSSEVISGCINNTGALQVEVTNALADSMVTRILNAVENAAASKPRMDRFVTRFSRVYTPIVVVIAMITAIVPSIVTGDWMHWIYTALSFLVISCPCALVLSVPLSFFAGIGAGSKRGILFKGGASLEALKNVRTVAMDKTGTLTKGNFIVQRIFPAEGMNETALLSMAASCEQHSTHPIAHSILSAAHERSLQIVPPSKVQEIAGQGIVAMISGVTVLCGSRNLLETAGIDLSGHTVKTAGTEVLIAASGRFAGSIVISDTIKTNTKIAMKNLRKLDLITVMLTGDAQDSAESVAAQLDIQEVRARLMPEEKLDALRDIRAQHGAVMYVGDGINDAPVLAGADVGAAMGSGSDAAIEAADVVFMTSDPLAIGDSIEIARSSIRIAWQNIIFALVVKLGFMVLGLFGIASMWLAVFADTGVAMLCVLNAIRILYKN
ncbi:MAG: cadmium-translocating P-type ATPase [Butyricicoccus pullicaecorum]|nr:cadmium-translocating P-type ATPase [Butyricicoccus pullicaecorum]